MSRLLLVAALVLIIAGDVSARCRRRMPMYPPTYYYVPAYSVSPAVFWGTPAPQPLPPMPFVPKAGVGVREEDEPPMPKPKESLPLKSGSEKESRIPKTKLPIPNLEELDLPPKLSSKKEPRTDKGKSFEQFMIPADENRAERPAEVKVGFFNHSDRAIELVVNGESLKLPSEQYVTMRLKRTFTWAEKGQKATDVAVPPDADGMEIVFRK